jgi:hypothetical protein
VCVCVSVSVCVRVSRGAGRGMHTYQHVHSRPANDDEKAKQVPAKADPAVLSASVKEPGDTELRDCLVLVHGEEADGNHTPRAATKMHLRTMMCGRE